MAHDADSWSKMPCNGILTFPDEKKFAILSKRFLYYDIEELEEALMIGWEDDTIPIYATFNTHYNNIIICTKWDVRIYGAQNGRIQKCFNEIIDKRTNADLTSFTIDDRNRKIFIGDTFGSIRVFNISNGVFIKHVNEIILENSDEEELEGEKLQQ